jgi:hypothetical protein
MEKEWGEEFFSPFSKGESTPVEKLSRFSNRFSPSLGKK